MDTIIQESNLTDRNRVEVVTLIENYFPMGRRYPGCIDSNEIARRLWKAFQLTGYINMKSEFKFSGNSELSELQFREMVLDEIASDKRSLTEFKEQRNRAMTDAYKPFESTLIEAIRNYYILDFELFGYESHPQFLDD